MPVLYLSASGTGVEGGWSGHTATLTPILLRALVRKETLLVSRRTR